MSFSRVGSGGGQFGRAAVRLHSTQKQASELKDFLTDPHPKMPNMSLSRSEIADIVAYIKTLDR